MEIEDRKERNKEQIRTNKLNAEKFKNTYQATAK